jgi:hypothetical protein
VEFRHCVAHIISLAVAEHVYWQPNARKTAERPLGRKPIPVPSRICHGQQANLRAGRDEQLEFGCIFPCEQQPAVFADSVNLGLVCAERLDEQRG